MITFGPVPSRRLGRSLGVNHVPPKNCSYACVYCQVGATDRMRIDRSRFLDPAEVVDAVARRIASCREEREPVDFVTFVPDGEPTLDLHLGEEIRGVRTLGVPVAVITNGSLLWRPEVREELSAADVVSVKVDAADERTWRDVNRPHGRLSFEAHLEGVRRFAREYGGELITETMLVAGRNDGPDHVEAVADLVSELSPARAWLAAPIRPPAEPGVAPPDEASLVRAHEIFRARVGEVELLIHEPEGSFGGGADPVADLLAILAVHPMRDAAVRAYLSDAGADPSTAERLVARGRVVRVEHGGESYFCHRIHAES
ncbi:MAG: radical SAM protein [Gemmatimonadota bacterium]